MSKRDFLSMADLTAAELKTLLESAAKAKKTPEKFASSLAGKQIAMIFEKPSTRTRVSFEAAISGMGGHALVLCADELQLGRGETIEDTGRVLSRYVDAIVIRTFSQNRLDHLAAAASVPIINALSDFSHPCQCLADLQTIIEHKGALAGQALAYLGDGNNVVHSLLFAGSKMGMDIRVATPSGYAPDGGVVQKAQETAAKTGGHITVSEVVAEAAVGADVLYTDVWASMGQEDETATRRQAFERYQLNSEVLSMAKDDAIVMHCLPAHRDQEITSEVLDGPQSVVWDQAENRLHSQKALLAWLLS